MLYSNLLLPLLTLSVAAPTISAARVPHGNARRAPHPSPDFEKVRREGTLAMEAREGSLLKKTTKGKRLVRKKRGTCQVPVSANGTSLGSVGASASSATSFLPSASSSSSSAVESATTSAIGGNEWASALSSSTTVASSTTSTAAASSTTSSAAAASSTAPSSSGWNLVERYEGSNFFDNFAFWSWDDPTHGTVDYLGASDAWNSGLVSINSAGHAIMAVDTTQQVQNARKSIRISANLVWTGGMVLMDAVHMPHGCGTWPAWWQNGPNWPQGGEIDILEGVNAFTQNQVSLHTGSGCTMPNNIEDNMSAQLTTGSYNSYDCGSYDTSNQGCGARDVNDNNSYGSGFNSVGGGVYAMVWDQEGIKVWFFQRSAIPSDITNEVPNPANWGTPVANFPSTDCSPYTYFYDHYNIFDTTLCGDWAGADGVWNYAGYAGQDQSCAAITGYSTCSDYVLNQGSAFSDAYWEVSYVKYFNSTTAV